MLNKELYGKKILFFTLGILTIATGLFVGLYVGIWLFLIKSFVTIVQQVQSEDINKIIVMINLFKMIFSGFLFKWMLVVFFKSGKIFFEKGLFLKN